jgi:cytochrome c biogenesis protein CcmG/thiol:disulfide interchange protein DsbE
VSKQRKGVNYTVLGLGVLLIVPMLWLLQAGFGTNPRELPSVLEGRVAPGFSLVDLDGERWSLEALKGRPVVLNFWSTWCGPCKAEHPLLQRAAQLHPDVQFLGVIYSDEPDKCRRYLASEGTTYDHLVDDAGRTAIDYGVGGVPETFFINAEGTIVHKQVGPLSAQTLAALLQRIRGGG